MEGHNHKNPGQSGDGHGGHIAKYRNRFWVCLILTLPVLALSETIQKWLNFEFAFSYREFLLIGLSTIIYFYGGWPFLTGSVKEIKEKRPEMMSLITLAITVSFGYSVASILFNFGRDFFWELATLIDVMLLGHWMEARSVIGASKALDELVKIIPAKAHLVKDGQTIEVNADELEVGNIALVKPGEKIPSDGKIVSGSSSVNESLITGESKPVAKSEGDKVIGGSINGEGSLKIKITKTGRETYISQVIKMVKEAQQSKSKTQDLAAKAAAGLFYAALASGAVTYAAWFFIGQADQALSRSITVLVIACPHALGLAIPLVVAISTSITAKNGLLIRNRRAFENTRQIDAIIFDKTGTLTMGEFGVENIISSAINDTLSMAAAVELYSEHTLARAIVSYAKEQDIEIPKAKNFKSIPGKGARAIIDSKEVIIASPNYAKELNIKNGNLDEAKKAEEKGKTVVHVIVDSKIIGSIALANQIRTESFEAVKKLKQMKIKTYMLTGDAEKVAESVANELGIDEYYAEILPDEKADIVKEIKKKNKKVAMVGDGINDAPALATADVGIAIGAGTDVAIESAEIILVKNNPLDAVRIIKFSEKTYSKMKQNLWYAAGYNIAAIPLAAGALARFGIILNPAVGALLMSLSTVAVAVNAQTLRKNSKL